MSEEQAQTIDPVETTPVEKAPAAETPPGRVSVGDSVKAALEKSAKTSIETVAPEKVRAEDGKFAKKQEPAQPPELKAEAPTEPVEPVEAPKATIKPPQSLKGELKEKFGQLPPEWQGEIDRLERVAVKKIQETSQLANFGRSLADEFAPYQDLLKQSGATPQQALKSFLSNEYILRTAPLAQKTATIINLARHYGVDLTGIQQGNVPQIDPQMQALHEENLRLRREQANRSNAESTQVAQTIEQFAADPKHQHFESVRPHMGMLMETGAATTLDDAYDQACWANPTIRNQLIQSQNSEAEAKRKADERKAVEVKKAAAGSIRGAPASPIPVAIKGETVGATLRRVAAQSQGRI